MWRCNGINRSPTLTSMGGPKFIHRDSFQIVILSCVAFPSGTDLLAMGSVMFTSYSMFPTEVHPTTRDESITQVHINSLKEPRPKARRGIGPLAKLAYRAGVFGCFEGY